MMDAETIAKGLTEAQRDIVLRLRDGQFPAWGLREDHDGRRAAMDIRKTRDIIEKIDLSKHGIQHWWYKLTPLGLAVCAALLKDPNAQS